jgi:hypothetical protein
MAIKKIYTDKDIVVILIGIACILLSIIPFIILRGNTTSIVINDCLDGAVTDHTLKAKYLFNRNINIFPEILHGMPRNQIVLPAPLEVFLYYFFTPLQALFIGTLLGKIIAFVGMFLLLKKIIKIECISFFVALIFSTLPFYHVFGLSITGQPLLIYSFINLYENEKIKTSICFVILYGLLSSLIYVGYIAVSVLGIFSIYIFTRGKIFERKFFLISIILLCICYIYLNISIISNILFNTGELTHRTEWIMSSVPFFENFKSMCLYGQYHAASLHYSITKPSYLLSLIGFIRYRKTGIELKNMYKILWFLVILTIFIALFHATFQSMSIVNIRNRIGGIIKYFQIDRFYWIYPTLWYFILGINTKIIFEETKNMHRFFKYFGILLIVCMFFITGKNVLDNSDIKSNFIQYTNLKKHGETNIISWNKFFAKDIFNEIGKYVGKDKSSFYVGSIGLHPSVAIYNGFYCIDGYSTSYPLKYKHEFRKIISKELDKNDRIKKYFDNWGSRVYIFSSELGTNYLFPKNTNKKIKNLELNIQKLKELNCQYIFSSVEILNSEKNGLKFEKSFESKNSFYKIYLYSVGN